MRLKNNVHASLRAWFIAHFLVDLLFGIPLLLVPAWFLRLFGWTVIDPLTARLVGAALLGVGGVSFWQRNAGYESYESLLRLKIIWSLSALFGIVLSIYEGGPRFTWVILAIFAAFSIVWVYYYQRLQKGKNRNH